MVQVPTSASSAHANRASSTNTTRSGTPSKGKMQANGHSNGVQPEPKQDKAVGPVLLSSLRSEPLDLSTVERRGQPTATKDVPKKNRVHGLQDAPSYYPTKEEFKDPFKYIKKISPEASQYGICKIIPPDDWQPDFAIDTETFHFRTRKQELNSIEGSTRANLTYLDQLAKFHSQHGTSLNKFPSVDKRPLDLYKLKKSVEMRGGFEKVCRMKKWAEIGRDLGYSGKIMSSLSTSLKNSYQRWLEPYEVYLRHAKPGVQAQLEFEYGGPMTPSPGQSPLKKLQSHQNTPSSLRNDSPAIRASDALNASMVNNVEMKDVPLLDAPNYSAQSTPAPQPARSGFTPVNAGGFTPVNAGGFAPVNVKPSPGGFTPVNMRRDRERESEGSFGLPWQARESEKPSPVPNWEQPAKATNGNSLKPSNKRSIRHTSQESSDSKNPNGVSQESDESNGRRSKRLKKESIPTVAGSHMSFLRPLGPRVPGEPGYFAPGEKCEQCGKGSEGGHLLVCDSCDHAHHMECLDPPLTSMPEYVWNCPRCLVGDGQFGFEDGGIYSLKQFHDKAAEFKEKYFADKMPFDPALKRPRPVTEDDVEREFWRLVASLEETVEVEYGADIHSTTHGSGFPTVESQPEDPYSLDPWNLNVMPMAQDSLFRHIKTDISGMTVPWLYVGMVFSTFCWHNEDHYAYSANYQHLGSTKTWYGIPGEDAEKFEAAMREAVPELFETQPDLLFQLVTLLTPEQLKKAGVRVYALDQRAGEMVITFPQAYHAGFNHGFNLNEAVNFAPKDWEPFGDAGVQRLQQFRRQPCFSHDELLWTAAEGHATGGVSVDTAKWLKPALERMASREFALRDAFFAKHFAVPHPCLLTDELTSGVRCQIKLIMDEHDVPEEDYSCVYCKSFCYLSRFVCENSGRVMCLSHAGSYDCCNLTEEKRTSGQAHALHYRRTKEAIDNIVQKVSDKASLPEVWEDKVTKALEEEIPSLKTLKSLLHEGEKIPYELPSLPVLKNFVDRCQVWVDEALSYLVRKQGRRKSEKKSKRATEAEAQEEKKLRNPANIERLLKEAQDIGFDAPEVRQLRDRSNAIRQFQTAAAEALKGQTNFESLQTTAEIDELLADGEGLQLDLPETKSLKEVRERARWNERANEAHYESLTLKQVNDLINEATKLQIFPNTHKTLAYLHQQKEAGDAWEVKARELMAAEIIHYPQLEALSAQAQSNGIPVSPDTLAKVDQILNKQREAHRKIISLYQRSKDPDITKRPKYTEVRDTMENLTELNSKPSGTLDLEKEQKRHEDWMRKGKKLFGKANAPLHILKTHMEYVVERNLDCFDIVHDKPRLPAEPQSREPSPNDRDKLHTWEDPRFREVFCICRRVEAGMMIECEHCHEWYHGKCLKIARGKVKEDEKYTCPICDWRVKIPRDAARPKLEDLIDWQAEIANLPFQPEEEALLSKIIDNAQDFRNHVAPFCNPIMATSEEAETQRFYLRKIEGAEVLLVKETNYFRKQLHKWSPVADEEPPVIEGSKSTRKPRPTKLQKLMAQHGVDDPELLPANLRTKQHTFKRKSSEPQNASGGHSRSHSLLPAGVSVINNKPNPLLHRPHENRLGGMGADMRLGYAPGMRQMGADGLFDRYSAHASPHLNNPYLGNNSATPERERWALDQHHTHMMPQGNMFGSTVDPSLDPSLGRNVSGLSAGQDGGIEKMFTDLTNADGVDAEREEAVRRAEGGAPDEEGAKEEGEDGGGQAGEMLGLYGEREEDDREGGREPGWF